MKNFSIISVFQLLLCGLLTAQGLQVYALDFGTSNDSLYVQVQDHNSLDITKAVTLEAWVYFRNTPGDWNVIMEKTNDEYGLYVRSNGVINFYTSGTFGQIDLDGTTVLDTNTWYHMAATYDSVSSTANVYINGHLDGTVDAQTDVLDKSNYPLRIGDDRGNDTAFDGLIDEVRVWNIARDSLDIQATMTGVLGAEYYNTAESGLIAYWRFDEAEGDTAYDLGVYGNHGEIRGAVFTTMTAPLGIVENVKFIPGGFQLLQNYPNPFNPATKITFTLPKPEHVSLAIYNTIGQIVATLLNAKMNAGSHDVHFDASNLPSGIYFYRIQVGDAPGHTGEFSQVRKMILLR